MILCSQKIRKDSEGSRGIERGLRGHSGGLGGVERDLGGPREGRSLLLGVSCWGNLI